MESEPHKLTFRSAVGVLLSTVHCRLCMRHTGNGIVVKEASGTSIELEALSSQPAVTIYRDSAWIGNALIGYAAAEGELVPTIDFLNCDLNGDEALTIFEWFKRPETQAHLATLIAKP